MFLKDTHPNPSPKALSKKKAGLCTGGAGSWALLCLPFLSRKCPANVFLLFGKVQVQGSPRALVDRYNFISGTVCSGDGKSTFS